MKCVFKYCKHIDLIFHVLNHMRVMNPSDLYSQKYIRKIQEQKREGDINLLYEVQSLEDYYNNNYERLSIINFLPFYTNTLEELIEMLKKHNFQDSDFRYFIVPMIELLERESVFYFDYWEEQYRELQNKRRDVEAQIEKMLENYKSIFEYYKKTPIIYLSLSISSNGRGFFKNENELYAAVPFPENPKDLSSTFIIILHEFTHQITDWLLQTEIRMNDDSHDLTEKMVILFDYYIIKEIEPNLLDAYFQWFLTYITTTDDTLSEVEFLELLSIPDSIRQQLLNLRDRLITR